nr:copper chaperone PCu(A)C [Streptomyces taklimakanensis]
MLATGATACGSGDGGSADAPRLTVEGAYMPEPVTADTAGGFLVIHNDGGTDDALTSASSDVSDDVQIHTTAGGRMRQAPSLPVPAGGSLELGRGGDHLMFMELDHQPTEGETVPVELRFEKSDPIRVEVPVEATNHVP